ncbi:hypothetical protein FA10DRAFT_266118 [Acaromyces ingoldii]|uniref:Uncharacterized protein n=1 Tax=Acaromyces ingoldii TaxID=215250 RepID=A0A316YSR1_9BASI|nr:hypothetical protein FA10DRAFT_266118 [Acaromyces ingoldii]PWN92339.1 hypothetical protein FA10DRAFT_266118 [Acaromyces ingoldii]
MGDHHDGWGAYGRRRPYAPSSTSSSSYRAPGDPRPALNVRPSEQPASRDRPAGGEGPRSASAVERTVREDFRVSGSLKRGEYSREASPPPRTLARRRSSVTTPSLVAGSSSAQLPLPLMQTSRRNSFPRAEAQPSHRAPTVSTSPPVPAPRDGPPTPLLAPSAKVAQCDQDATDSYMRTFGKWVDARRKRDEREQELQRFADILRHKPDAGKTVEDKVKAAQHKVDASRQDEKRLEAEASRALRQLIEHTISSAPVASTAALPSSASTSSSRPDPELSLEEVKRLVGEQVETRMSKAMHPTKSIQATSESSDAEPGEVHDTAARASAPAATGTKAEVAQTAPPGAQASVEPTAEETSEEKPKPRRIVPSRNEIVRRVDGFEARLDEVHSELTERLDEFDFLDMKEMVEKYVEDKLNDLRDKRRAAKRKANDVQEAEAEAAGAALPAAAEQSARVDGAPSTLPDTGDRAQGAAGQQAPSSEQALSSSSYLNPIVIDSPDSTHDSPMTTTTTAPIPTAGQGLATASAPANGAAAAAVPLGEETMPMGQVVEAIQALESNQERKMRDMLMQFEQTMNAREAAWQQALKDDFDRLFKVRDNHYEGKIKALRERLLALEAPLAESLRLSTQVAGHEKALLEHANCIVEIGRELCNIDSAFANVPVARHPVPRPPPSTSQPSAPTTNGNGANDAGDQPGAPSSNGVQSTP